MNTKTSNYLTYSVTGTNIGVFLCLEISINSTLKEREGRVDYISTRQETQSREEIIKRFDLYNKAIETLNDSMCKSIVWDADMKIRCSEEIYTTRAVKEMNVHLCEKINNPNILNSCKNNFFYKNALLSKAQIPAIALFEIVDLWISVRSCALMTQRWWWGK